MDPAKQETSRSSKRQKRGEISNEPPRSDVDVEEEHYHPAVSTLRSALSRRFELLAELSALDATISQARADIKSAEEDVLEPDSLAVRSGQRIRHRELSLCSVPLLLRSGEQNVSGDRQAALDCPRRC